MYFFYPEASILYFIDVQEPISSSPLTFTALLRMRRIQPRIPERRSTAPSAGLPLQDKGGWGLKEHPVPATNPGCDPGIGHCVPPSGRVPRDGRGAPGSAGMHRGCTQTLLALLIIPNHSYTTSKAHTSLLRMPRCVPGSHRFQGPC